MFSLIPLPVKLAILGGLFVLFTLSIGGAGWFGYYQGGLKSKVAIAELVATHEREKNEWMAENQQISDEVRIEYVDRVETIRDNQIVYRDAIQTMGPSTSNVTNGWVEVHDASATNRQTSPLVVRDTTPSPTSDIQALAVVVDNYGTCHQTREQLLALQSWIRQNQESLARRQEGGDD